jgi:hypothetical protein
VPPGGAEAGAPGDAVPAELEDLKILDMMLAKILMVVLFTFGEKHNLPSGLPPD